MANECPLCEAANSGNIAEVRKLIANGKDINTDTVNRYGRSPLVLATRKGHIEVVKVLLDAGANINTAGDRGNTALIYAALYNEVEIAKLLLSNNPDVHVVNKPGKTALEYATQKGHTEIAAMIRVYGYPLHVAAQSGSVSEVKKLLANGADPNALDDHRTPPLVLAAQSGDILIIKELLKAGANIRGFDKHGRTAVYYTNGRISALNVLVSAGADINARDIDRATPLIHAAKYPHPVILRELILLGANPDIRDREGYTAWDYIKGKKRAEIFYTKAVEEWYDNRKED